MLDLYLFNYFCSRCAVSIFCLLIIIGGPIWAYSPWNGENNDLYINADNRTVLTHVPSYFDEQFEVEIASNYIPTCEGIWLQRYVDAIGDDTTLEEAISFVVGFHNHLVLSGHQLPPLHDLIWEYRKVLEHDDIFMTDTEFAEIYMAVLDRENTISSACYGIDKRSSYISYNTLVKSEKKKEHKKKEMKFSGKMVFGFIKFIAGGMCCIIPHPATLAIGTTIAASGICDMIDAAKNQGDVNELEMLRRRQNQGQNP